MPTTRSHRTVALTPYARGVLDTSDVRWVAHYSTPGENPFGPPQPVICQTCTEEQGSKGAAVRVRLLGEATPGSERVMREVTGASSDPSTEATQATELPHVSESVAEQAAPAVGDLNISLTSTTLSLACWNGLCDHCDDPACDCPDDVRSLCVCDGCIGVGPCVRQIDLGEASDG